MAADSKGGDAVREVFFFFFSTLVTGPARSLSLKLSDTRVYEPQVRARLGTTAHFCRRQGRDQGRDREAGGGAGALLLLLINFLLLLIKILS